MPVRGLRLVAVAMAIVVIGLGAFGRSLWIPFRVGLIERSIVTAHTEIEDLRSFFPRGYFFVPPRFLEDLIFSANVKNVSGKETAIRVSVALFDKGYRLVCAGSRVTEDLRPRQATNVEISLGRCGGNAVREGRIQFFQVAASPE
jgi:hypothetical protein